MLTSFERALGHRANLDMLSSPKGVAYLNWGSQVPEDADRIVSLGTIGLVVTNATRIGDETHTVETTNRAIAIDTNSLVKQRRFTRLYRECVGPIQGSLSIKSAPDEDGLDTPDYRDALIARTAFDLVEQGVITLAGFTAFEYAHDGKTHQAHAIFCAEALTQNMALDFREELIRIEPHIDAKEPETDLEVSFKAVTQEVIHQAKVMSPIVQDVLGTNFAVDNLPRPNELRSILGFAPPKKKRK